MLPEGEVVGAAVGLEVGVPEDEPVGVTVGTVDGTDVGADVGADVGTSVTGGVEPPFPLPAAGRIEKSAVVEPGLYMSSPGYVALTV